MTMVGKERRRHARLAMILGISVAVGALLVLNMLPSTISAVRLERQAAPTGSPATCEVGSGPQDPAYDPVDRDTYVPNYYSGTVTVLSGTCAVVTAIPLPSGAAPVQAVFDPGDNDIFVTDYALSQVYEISGTKLVLTITNGSVAGELGGPWGITYDPDYYSLLDAPVGALFVTDLNTNRITALQPCPSGDYFGECGSGGNGYYASYAVGSQPLSIVYDPGDGDLWVSNSGSNTVSAVEAYPYGIGKTTEVVTLPVGGDPREVALDLATGFIYVPDYATDNITVIEGSPAQDEFGSVVGSIPADGPMGAAWDQSTLHMYVTDFASDQLLVIGGSSGLKILKTETLSVAGVNGISYDSANGQMFVTGFDDGYVEVTS